MKTRSKEELVDCLNSISKWRKKELITLDGMAKDKKSCQSIFLRTSIVIAYAHWEGFVKEASLAYLTFLSTIKPRLDSMSENFVALYCRDILVNSSKTTKKINRHIDVVSLFTKEMPLGIKYDKDLRIDTESNLNGEVFENICLSLGINYRAFWSTKKPFIDALVENRCKIAHGENFTVDKKYAIEVIDFSIKAIQWFKTDIENAVIQEAYLCTSRNLTFDPIET